MPDAENSLDVLSQLLFPLPLSTCRLEYPFNKRPYHGIEPRILLSLSLFLENILSMKMLIPR